MTCGRTSADRLHRVETGVFHMAGSWVIWATTRQGRHRGHVEGARVDGLRAATGGLDLLARRAACQWSWRLWRVGGAGGSADPPARRRAQDGDAHELVTFRRPRRRVRSNSLFRAASESLRPARATRLVPGETQEVLGDLRSPLGQPGRRRRPAGSVQSNRSPSAKCSTRSQSGSASSRRSGCPRCDDRSPRSGGNPLARFLASRQRVEVPHLVAECT